VRAAEGAISHVLLGGNPHQADIQVIGDSAPIGLCGTAYMDFVAQARQADLITTTGRFGKNAVNPHLFQHEQHGLAFRVGRTSGKESLVVSEADIARLLQAKAAIAAGIVCLLKRVGIRSEDVHTLYLAGGFGFHMNIDHVIACGLLPGFTRSQIRMVGNTSLAGAYLALVDAGVLREIRHICEHLETVELNLDPDFESCYIDQLILP
jgi:uncharacterized 2Fe-2S/4Fe-4S cluster protein (DUF4445 family)